MKILVPVDGSKNSLNAVQFIGSRKTLLGSEPKIELLNVQLPLPARACRLVGQDAIQRYYEDEAEKVFEPSRKILEKEGYQASEAFTVGEAAPTIAKAAEDIDADLIVMGSRGQSALKGLFFGSVSNGVLAQSKRPMLVIRDELPTPADSLRVGIAIDGSKYGRAAVRYVLKHLPLFGTQATFYLINVVSDYAGAVMPDMAGMALKKKCLSSSAKSSMKQWIRCVRSLPSPPLKRRKFALSATRATKSPLLPASASLTSS